MSAFEQSLANMTARLQALTTSAEQKVQVPHLLHKSSIKVSLLCTHPPTCFTCSHTLHKTVFVFTSHVDVHRHSERGREGHVATLIHPATLVLAVSSWVKEKDGGKELQG